MYNMTAIEYWQDVYKNKIKFPSNTDGSIIPWEIKRHDKYLEKLLEKYNFTKGKVLELGCGLGYDSSFLSQIGFDVTAIDISQEVIDTARNLHRDSKVKFLPMNFFDTLPNAKFDIIYDRGFLHNYKSKLQEIFNKLSEITEDEAKLILITGNPNTKLLDTCMPPTVTISEIEFFSMHWFKIISVEEIEFEVNEHYQSSQGYIFLLGKRKDPLNY